MRRKFIPNALRFLSIWLIRVVAAIAAEAQSAAVPFRTDDWPRAMDQY